VVHQPVEREGGGDAEDQELENLDLLLIDGAQVDFLAAAFVRTKDVGEPEPGATPWSLVVTEPSVPLPRLEMNVIAVTRAGAVYAGRGKWRDQRISRDRGLHTDLVLGLEEPRIGRISELGSDQHVTSSDAE